MKTNINILSGFLYKFLERVGVQGSGFVISLLLARILTPNEYGIVALVLVIITVLEVFVTFGFGNSLVVDNQSSQLDFSTCFYFSIILSLIIYLFIYLLAPLLSDWLSYDTKTAIYKYDINLLNCVIRVMAIKIPISAINSIQVAFIQKNLLFSKSLYASLLGTLISGIFAIILAYKGFGVWALVFQNLINTFLNTLILFFLLKWFPSLMFSFKRLKKIYDYGWKILCVGLIDVWYSQLRSFVIAKKYSATDLAYYNKGHQFPSTGMDLIESTINGVLFPLLSKCNDNKTEMEKITSSIINLSTYITFPLMIGLYIVSDSLVLILLTEKWIEASIYIKIGCLAFLLRPLQSINACVIRASGKSGMLLYLNIIKKSVGIILLIISIPYGVPAIAFSFVIVNIIATIINILPIKTLIGYGFKDQFRDFIINALPSAIMGFFLILISYIDVSLMAKFIIQIMSGIIIYITASFLMKNKSFYYILKLLKNH